MQQPIINDKRSFVLGLALFAGWLLIVLFLNIIGAGIGGASLSIAFGMTLAGTAISYIFAYIVVKKHRIRAFSIMLPIIFVAVMIAPDSVIAAFLGYFSLLLFPALFIMKLLLKGIGSLTYIDNSNKPK